MGNGVLPQRLLGRAIVDQAAQFVVDGQQFVDAGPSLVARAIACRATLRRMESRALVDEGFAAFQAEEPHQPLGADADHAGGEQEGLHAHVDQPRDGAHRIIRMKRGEHKVPRKARLNRDLCSLQIADLADHHDVGVLAQYRAQGAREAHFDPGIDLGLADAVEVVLDRILDGHDVQRFRIQPRQRGVQRRGLARPGGAGDQDDAVRLANQRIHLRERRAVHAEARQVQPAGLLVQQAQHHALAVPGRNRRYPDVDRLACHPQRDPAVLRQALLGDIELRHDLDARNDRGMQRARGLEQVAQGAIDSQSHDRARFERLDVDVGGAVPERLREQRVDQADQGRVVLAIQQVLDPGYFLQQPRQVQVMRQIVGKCGGASIRVVVLRGNQLVELRGTDSPRVQRHAQYATQLGQRACLRAFAHGDPGAVGRNGGDDDAIRFGERVRNSARDHRGGNTGGG